MRRPLGFRRRLRLSLVAMVVLTVAIVGTISVVLVDRSLRQGLIAEAMASTEFNVTVLLPAADLLPDPDVGEIEASGLFDRFLSRGAEGVWVTTGDGEVAGAGVTGVEVAPELEAIARAGEVGYQFAESVRGPVLVTAARLPATDQVFYFVFSARAVTDAIRQVLIMVGGAGAVALILGLMGAGAATRRMLRPVEDARRAAEKMTEGDLGVRLSDVGDDEFGRLSGSFNAMAASLEHTITELEAARARERRFVADVSHELRTPVTGLVNEAGLLLQRLQADPGSPVEHVDVASMIQADVARLRHLVEDLLEVSRLDSDTTTPEFTPVDIERFLRALIAERHPEADLVSAVSEPISTDPRSLERIVGNLLDNARIHAAGADVTVGASLGDGQLEIEVADRGPGVDADQLDGMFDRFTTTSQARGGGTGLGLAIAAQHARRLGGTLVASRRPGGGLVLTLRVPVVELLHDGDGAAMRNLQSDQDQNQGDPA